jgi:hypothetical protein
MSPWRKGFTRYKETVAPIYPCEAFGNIVVAVNSSTSRIISNIYNAYVLLLSILI